jgi:hypothetical protein
VPTKQRSIGTKLLSAFNDRQSRDFITNMTTFRGVVCLFCGYIFCRFRWMVIKSSFPGLIVLECEYEYYVVWVRFPSGLVGEVI